MEDQDGAAAREFDVVLFGASGFTGRLTAEYLAAKGGELRWAIAGRNRDKLAEVKKALVEINPACEAVDILIADIDDAAALRVMSGRARVVASTVGPYIRYGLPLVAACVDTGTDYCDITGEPEFVDQVRRQYSQQAEEQHLRLVSCCGFDSIPHDLGAYFTAQQLPSDQPMRMQGFVLGQGSFSGGTWQSAVEAMGRFFKAKGSKKTQRGKSGARRRTPSDRKVRSLPQKVFYEKRLRTWACPLPTIDPVIVLRSAKQLDRYGPDFRYGHYLRVKSLPKLAMGGMTVASIFTLAQLSPTRRWLMNRRQSGEGPDAELRAKSRFSVTFHASAGDRRVRTQVRGGDPGYGETSKMLAESAMTLALDRDRLPEFYGAITPAVAMGDVLLQRLQAAGIVFEVLETNG